MRFFTDAGLEAFLEPSRQEIQELRDKGQEFYEALNQARDAMSKIKVRSDVAEAAEKRLEVSLAEALERYNASELARGALEETLSEVMDAKDQADREAVLQSHLAEQAERALDEAQALIAYPELSEEDKQILAAKWQDAMCVHCGGYHVGVCNRVRTVTLDEIGRKSTVVYWDTWEPNPGTIWPDQVWGSVAQRARDIEEATKKATENEAMAQAVATQLRQQAAAEQQRRSPIELAKDIIGS